MKKETCLALLLLAGGTVFSQESFPSDFSRLSLESVIQQFESTNNAAGMGLFQPASGSHTSLEAFYGKGDFHRAQEGDSRRGFTFSTLRYDSFSDKLFMRGRFEYSQDREMQRKWSDVRDPWFSIPYIYGNAVPKDYYTQRGNIAFDLYTAPLNGWFSAGIRTMYEVSDISGNRDPRPRTGSLDYRLVPSVLFTAGRHHFGIDAGYGFSKEKLSGLTTIQAYPNLYYYKMAGLDHVDGAIAAYSGFKRQFSGDKFLGDLSYAYISPTVRLTASGGMEYGELNAYGDKMHSPGAYNYYLYSGVADFQLRRGRYLHRLHLEGEWRDAGADEYLQELISTKDPVTGATTETWSTLYTYKNRYMLNKYDLRLGYTIFSVTDENGCRWSAEAGAGRTGFLQECHLPLSFFETAGWNADLAATLRLFEQNRHRIDLGVSAAGYLHEKALQQLQYDNPYTREVLVPDLEFFRKDHITLHADLTWTFPIKLGKAGLANGYLRLSGGDCIAFPEGNLIHAAVSFGLFTF